MDAVLVGPGGQQVVLLGGVGYDTAASNVTLTFDDSAASVIPDAYSTGTFRPSGGVYSMPSPGPAGPYSTELSAFNGSSPNGTWSLYIADGYSGDTGRVATGWTLSVQASQPACCAGNQPPVLSPIGNRAVVWSNTLSFAVTAADPVDNDPITLSVSNAPAGATFGSTNGAGTFTWADAGPLGVYTCTFYAVDNDGPSQETILITVGDGSCVGSNILVESFDASTSVPAGWTNGGTANDANATHYQSAPNCRAIALGNTLVTPAVDYPTQLVFYVDSSSGGEGKTGLVEYAISGGSYTTLGTFRSSQTGSNVTFVMNASPDLSSASAVTFRFSSSFNTWYLDDVALSGGCAGVPVDTNGYPAVAITTTPQVVSNAIATIAIGGTANTNVVGLLAWTNALSGSAGTTAAATNWLISSVPLAVGSNTITVRATNAGGVAAVATVAITRSAGGGGGDPSGLTNLLFQGFEPGDGWIISAGASLASTNTGSTDTPAGQRVRTGAYSWQSINGSNTLDLAATSIAGATARVVRLRLSSTSATANNGADPADLVRVFAALDGAAFSASPDLQVGGNSGNNSRWGFWATNTLSTTAGTPVTNASPQANQSSNNVSTLVISLPDSATQVAVRVVAFNNSASEIWNVDDIEVAGLLTGGPVNPDTDGDGVEDAWEQLYFTNLTSVTTTSDFDGDGFIDLHEFLAGTDPLSPTSLLKAVSVSNATAGAWIVRWQSASNRVYRLSRAADLFSGFEPIASNLPAVPPVNVYTDAAPTNAVQTYRVELQ